MTYDTPNTMRMSFLERCIALVAPARANYLVQQRAAWSHINENMRAMFGLAESNRQNANWNATYTDINYGLATELTTMRNRSRWLVRRNPYAASAQNTLVNYVVGTGFELQMTVARRVRKDGAIVVEELDEHNDTVEDVFRDWAEDVTITSTEASPECFAEAQRLLMRLLFTDGEAFIHLVTDTRHPVVPLRLNFIEPEALDTFRTSGTDGNPVLNGIEVNRRTWQPLAYWIKSMDAASSGYIYDNDSVRVPAKDMIHVFDRVYPRQMRGIPWLGAVGEKLFQTEEYAYAHLIRGKIAALFAVLFKNGGVPGGMMSTSSDTENGGSKGFPKDADGNPIRNLAPGMMGNLGRDVEPFVINPTAPEREYLDFLRSNLGAIGAGVAYGMSYVGLTRDTSQTTFASGTAARQMDAQGYRPIQRLVAAQGLSSICRAWMDRAVLSEAIVAPGYHRDPRFWQRHTWLPCGWSIGINPLQEVTAARDSMEAGMTTLADECGALGRDWRAQVRMKAKIERYAKSQGTTVGSARDPDATALIAAGDAEAAAEVSAANKE